MKLFFSAALFLFFCSVFSLSAAVGHGPDEALIATGVREEIEQDIPEILGHFAPMRKDFQPAFAKVYDSLSTAIFQSDSVYTYALGQWLPLYDSARVATALEWLRTPTGKIINTGLIKACAPAARREIAGYAKRMKDDEKLRKRVAPLEKSVENSAQSKAELMVVLSRQLIKIINTMPAEDAPLSDVQIGQLVENMRPALLDYYRNLERGFYIQAFKAATDKQIKAYADFLATEDGQWFEHQRRRAISQAYYAAGARFVLALKSSFEAIVANPTDPATAYYFNNLMKQQPNTNKVLGVVEATFDNREWVGFFNAEVNPDSSITLLALNTESNPQEQVEITFSFDKGPAAGTYRIAESKGVHFKLDKDRKPLEVLSTTGQSTDVVSITGYDELQGVIEGTIHASFVGELGPVEFQTKPFVVRLK